MSQTLVAAVGSAGSVTTTANSKFFSNFKADIDARAAGVDTLASKIGKLVSITDVAKKALSGMFSVLNASSMQKTQESTLQAMLNNDKVGSQLYAYVGEYSKTSALGRANVTKGVSSFLTSTRDIDQIEQLVQLTERLYAKDPNKNADGAIGAVTAALGGDSTAMRENYGIAGLDQGKMSQMAQSGDTTGQIAYLDEMMNRFGATQSLVDDNFNTLTTQIDIFKQNIQSAIADQATPVMETLVGVVQRMNADLQAGKYQPFFELIINGMQMVGDCIAWIAENATWLIPVIAGVVAGIIAYNIVMAVAAVVTMGLQGNWGGIALMAVAVTGAVVGMSAAMSDVEKKSANAGKNLGQLKSEAKTGLGNTPLPTEITNTAPIAVTGNVEIEKENLKYMMDIAGQSFFAQYSHNTLAPQMVIQNQNISKEADWEDGFNKLGTMLEQASESAPQGVYA